jgi:hypothetical protein
MFRVQAYDENRIKNLMWTTGASRMQYKYFGNAITMAIDMGKSLVSYVCSPVSPFLFLIY